VKQVVLQNRPVSLTTHTNTKLHDASDMYIPICLENSSSLSIESCTSLHSLIIIHDTAESTSLITKMPRQSVIFTKYSVQMQKTNQVNEFLTSRPIRRRIPELNSRDPQIQWSYLPHITFTFAWVKPTSGTLELNIQSNSKDYAPPSAHSFLVLD